MPDVSPPTTPEPATRGASVHPPPTRGGDTLDLLLARMAEASDFPALSDSVLRIQGMASSETESIASVTNEILKDVALTHKLLRLVNSAHYARGGGSISTVSRAVSLVGFNGIRNMALGLVLLEHMQDQAHADVLKAEFLRCLMAGSIAQELWPALREREEAFIGAMFQNLGHLLAEFYFPQEALAVRTLVASAQPPMAQATASTRVLGLDFEALGEGVAKVWGLPEGIRRCMRKPGATPPTRVPAEPLERIRWIAAAANEIADTLLRTEPGLCDAQLAQVAARFARALDMRPEDIAAATLVARRKLIDLAHAMELHMLPGSDAARLLQAPKEDAYPPPGQDPAGADPLKPLELQATKAPSAGTVTSGAPALAEAHDYRARILTAGIQDIAHAMVEDFKLNDVLRMVLEAMFRALDLKRIVFCMRDPRSDTLTGRFGLGGGIEPVVKAFAVALKAVPPDLFAAVCLRGADTMISDSTEPRIAARLAPWYRASVNAPTFLLLPLLIKGTVFGLIYADQALKGALALDEKELSLLRTLRNQAVMAFKQAG